MQIKLAITSLAMLTIIFVILGSFNELLAQRRQIQIGGADGVVIGGGSGVRIGGADGVQFGAGRGARFGPAGQGVQLGGGRGLRIGSFLLGGPTLPSTPMAYPNNALIRPPSGPPSILAVDASAKDPLEYRLNGTPFRLNPGREVKLPNNQRWTVRFSPGKQQPDRSVILDEPGRYVFRKSEQGWDLIRQPIQPMKTKEGLPNNSAAPAPITIDKARRRIQQRRQSTGPEATEGQTPIKPEAKSSDSLHQTDDNKRSVLENTATSNRDSQ